MTLPSLLKVNDEAPRHLIPVKTAKKQRGKRFVLSGEIFALTCESHCNDFLNVLLDCDFFFYLHFTQL